MYVYTMLYMKMCKVKMIQTKAPHGKIIGFIKRKINNMIFFMKTTKGTYFLLYKYCFHHNNIILSYVKYEYGVLSQFSPFADVFVVLWS